MKKLLLSSSILSANFLHLEDQIRAAEKAGVDWIHFDIMDGSFVPNISMGPFVLEAVRKVTSLPFDVHLMINHPEKFIDSFINAGANRLTIHIENNPNIFRTLQAIKKQGAFPGVAINPGTSASNLEAVLPFTDMVLVMTVNPGFSGQTFIPEMTKKISQVRDMINNSKLSTLIEVDGGINEDTIHEVTAAGANVVVAASAIFRYSKSISEGVKILREKALYHD